MPPFNPPFFLLVSSKHADEMAGLALGEDLGYFDFSVAQDLELFLRSLFSVLLIADQHRISDLKSQAIRNVFNLLKIEL